MSQSHSTPKSFCDGEGGLVRFFFLLGVNMSAEEDCLVEVWGGWTMVQRCNEVGKMLSVERCKTMDGFLP